MAVALSYPGVYIEEVPSGVRTITGVATSIAAFVDNFARGPLDKPVRVLSFADFERAFGGLNARSEASYAVQQFFLNGGAEAWVVRAASGTFRPASVAILGGIGGSTAALTVTARDPGEWGNGLRVLVDHLEPATDARFNLTITLSETRNGQTVTVATEVFRDLSMSGTDSRSRFVGTVVNDEETGSRYVTVAASGTTPPLQNGTTSGELDPFPTITAPRPALKVKIDGTEKRARLAAKPGNIGEARRLLEDAIRAADPARRTFADASVQVAGKRLRIRAGGTDPGTRVEFATPTGDTADPTAGKLGLVSSPAGQRDGRLSAAVAGTLAFAGGTLAVTVGGTAKTLTLGAARGLAAAGQELEKQLRLADPSSDKFAKALVATFAEGTTERLLVLAGEPGEAVSFTASPTATSLGLGTGATAVRAAASGSLSPVPVVDVGDAVEVKIGTGTPFQVTFTARASALADIAGKLQELIRGAGTTAAFTGFRVVPYASRGENRLFALAGDTTAVDVMFTAAVDMTSVTELQLDTSTTGTAKANVNLYALDGSAITGTAQGAGTVGASGDPPDALALIAGVHTLERVDLFNILCLPRVAVADGPDAMDAAQAAAVLADAATFCERRRAFLLVDTPKDLDEVDEIAGWVQANAPASRRNAAVYFPRVQIPDPLNAFRLRSVGASGTVAGIYARTDGTRGVWKAPAGLETRLVNVQRLDRVLTDGENGVLNPLGINCLRSFPVHGIVGWGSRTLDGSDQAASEWKYVPVRRLALFLEESLYRGTQWVVFEPNDEPLWAQIRLNVGAFMQNLFRQGAFQGRTPQEAYLVKCDRETTTQNDINLGIVNILVGFAPLKPAEFVVIKIQQLAGQVQA